MIKVVYFATPEIAVNGLKKLAETTDIDVLGCVTMPDRPAGRGNKLCESPIKKFAVQNSVKLFQTPSVSKDRELIEVLKSLKPDFFVTFAFGQIISQEVIDIPKYGVINLHASLLPAYRGANPIQRALVNGDKETGITTMRTVLKMDAGDICLQEKIQITENMNTAELSQIISEKAPNLICQTLRGIVSEQIIPIQQNEALVTFASKFTKDDGHLSFQMKAEEFHNRVRGLIPWPCSYIINGGVCVQIMETETVTDETDCPEGTITDIRKDGIVVKCGKNAILIKTVKPQCKSSMPASSWINGLRLKKGDRIGE